MNLNKPYAKALSYSFMNTCGKTKGNNEQPITTWMDYLAKAS